MSSTYNCPYVDRWAAYHSRYNSRMCNYYRISHVYKNLVIPGKDKKKGAGLGKAIWAIADAPNPLGTDATGAGINESAAS